MKPHVDRNMFTQTNNLQLCLYRKSPKRIALNL